ncbi:MAG TPA: zf-HC2 domain-containing protein [Thermoleophilaceae bacterium]|nr:zf-HC2 domain-containing protein [Thermoleophilaceae bacterium]
MERAPLRPVPRRPSGPVDPRHAVEAVERKLPALDERAAAALALVTLAGRSRPEAAARLDLGEEDLAAALAAGRKALRRSVAPLAGSGWCERAERLISDRLDDAIDDTGAARLDVHLRNCERCVEHERRLVQATDALVAEVAGHSLVPGAATPPAELRAVGPAGGTARAATPPIAVLPFGEPVAPGGARVPLPRAVEPRSIGELAAVIAWRALFALSLLLAVAAVALALIGVLGGEP